jgi:hypothetical protein
MTPKEKAQELVDKFNYESKHYLMLDAKQCALIAVDEIIGAIDWHEFETPNKELTYWQQVKHEINNL